MSTEENKAFVRRYLGEISGKDKPRAVQNQYIADSDESSSTVLIKAGCRLRRVRQVR